MSRIKLTATPSTRIAAITAKMIVPIPPVDGRRDPVLFSISMILSFSAVPSLEIVHSVSPVFVIVTLIGAVSLLYPAGASVSTSQ